MRLINADALEADGWCMNRTIQVGHNAMELQTKMPKDFPTIEERNKGKWVLFSPKSFLCSCSLCGQWSDRKWNFCPNCGADMREGREE